MTPEGRSSRMDEGLAWDVVPYVIHTDVCTLYPADATKVTMPHFEDAGPVSL